jgi:ABC-2 type transport system permease protein
VVVGVTLAFFGMAVVAYDPGRGIMARRGGPAGETP